MRRRTPKNIEIDPCFTELFKKIEVARFFETRCTQANTHLVAGAVLATHVVVQLYGFVAGTDKRFALVTLLTAELTQLGRVYVCKTYHDQRKRRPTTNKHIVHCRPAENVQRSKESLTRPAGNEMR